MANQKGGSGKTTAAMVIAGEVIALGGRVVFIEGDPNRHLARWATSRGEPVIDAARTKVQSTAAALETLETTAGEAKLIVVTTDNDDREIFEWLEAAAEWAHFVIVDPEGSPNQWMATAMSQADLVVIPFSPTAMDANQVAMTVRHLRSIEKIARKSIPFRVVLTRSNPVPTKDERELRKRMADAQLPMLETFLQDRPAFRALFMRAALLHELSEEEINGLPKARLNAKALLKEIGSAIEAAEREGVAA
jgi:chromosome partitioning protein